MDILIVGKYGVVTDALINKLNKEGNNVFVLMGEGYHGKKHKYVYEHYSFDYTSDSVTDVISSVKPQCIIFTGAYDGEFSWEHPNQDALKYVSAAMNIALIASTLKIPRFICLSSNDVFEDSAAYMLDENEPVTAASAKGIAIAQGEKIFLGCAADGGMQVTVLRLDNLYGVPFSKDDVRSCISRMCLKALENGEIKANGNNVSSHLHLNDAAQAVLNIVNCPHPKYDLYHITDENPVSDLKIAEYINLEDDRVSINDDTGVSHYQIVLSGRRFNQEFNFKVFNPVWDSAPYIFSYMKKHSSRFIGTGKQSITIFQRIKNIWHAVLPFLENILCVLALCLITQNLGISQYIKRIDLYLIYTIVFSLFYGKTQGIFSAFLSVIAYAVYNTDSGSIFIDASTYVWIAVLFIIGMAVGHMKDKLSASAGDKDDEIDYLAGRLSDVNAINRSNMRIKEVLKDQIISYDGSLATLYNAVSVLDKTNAINVMFQAAEMLQTLLKARDIAIYRAVRGGFARLITTTTQRGKKLGVSYDFEKVPEIYETLMKRQVYINKSMNPELPMMVSAIFSDEKIDMIITVWNLHYEQLTLHEADMLTILGHMIQDSVRRSNRYTDADEMQKHEGCNRILRYEAFLEMEQVYRNAASRGLAESSVLTVDDKDISVSKLDEMLPHLIRDSDFIGIDPKGQVFILLSNANASEASFVIERIKRAGLACSLNHEMIAGKTSENEGKE